MLSKSIDNNILTLTLDRPDLHNAFNDELIAILTSEFLDIPENIRFVLLKGNGKSFCAGADLNWMKAMKNYSQEENYNDSVRLSELFYAVKNCAVPVIGIIHGAALGGGVGLVAACDYAMGVRDAKFGLTEVNLGLIPAVISPFVIEKIGVGNARAFFLSGERFDGQKAYEIGLLHKVVDRSELEQAESKLVERFLATGPKASRKSKDLIKINEDFFDDPHKLKHLTCQMIAGQRTSDEGQEGMSALLEKRKPNWVK